MKIAVGCRCGGVHGSVEASAGASNRGICYCGDCQAFAHFLGTAGILDARGGSDIFQTTPSRLRLESGTANLACVRLSPEGMLRWYAACCRTPIGNAMTAPRMPFVGLVQPFMKHTGARDAEAGPVRVHFGLDRAIGGAPPGAKGFTIGAVLHFARFLGAGFLRGAHRPTPFRDEQGRPVVTPQVLTAEERARLDRPAR